MGNCLLKMKLQNYDEKKAEWLNLKGKEQWSKCIEVVDGDTITVITKFKKEFVKVRCRLVSIDAPELKPKKQGRTERSIEKEKQEALRSKEWLSSQILGKVIYTCFENEQEKFGRHLVNIKLTKKGESLNMKMIELGLATPYGIKNEY